jgi:hypothetical protein
VVERRVHIADVAGSSPAAATNVAIAAQYGVTHQIISKIRRGAAWGREAMQPPYASLKRGIVRYYVASTPTPLRASAMPRAYVTGSGGA